MPASADARLGRYLHAEQAMWGHYGLAPSEQFIQLESPAARLRMREIGSGDPVLFVHGTAGPAAWAPLVRELSDFRCLMLDRPGWTQSTAVDYSKHNYGTVVADLQKGVLDALGVERAHVVGSSIGNVWALRLAASHPSRVDRIVLLGGGPLRTEVPIPGFIRMLSTPIGVIMARVPEKSKMTRSILKQMGHGANLEAGRIPDEFIEWRGALTRETGSMRDERKMVSAVASWRGWRPGLTFEDEELARIRQPALYLYGTADTVGTPEIFRRLVDLLPNGEFRLVDGGSHEPWFDDPSGIGGEVSRFLAA